MSCRDPIKNILPDSFNYHVDGIGDFHIRPLCRNDFILLHQWVTASHANFWGMQNNTLEEVVQCYCQQMQSDHHSPYMGFYKGKPAFLLETYDPEKDELGQHYKVITGDIGMHLLVAPVPLMPIHGFSRAVMNTILIFLFTNSAIQRVVVEPDVRNEKIHPLNRIAGFQYLHNVKLSHKTAWLAICDRASFLKTKGNLNMTTLQPVALLTDCPHLNPDIWQKVNRLLIRKALSEFAHENLLEPIQVTSGKYFIRSDDEKVSYYFNATVLDLNHWSIPADSISKLCDGQEQPLDALLFMIELRQKLLLKESIMPVYLDEISSTLYGSAYKHDRDSPKAFELIHADFQKVETAMTEGHPCFVANNGRLGFDANDYQLYAPEAAVPFQVVWLAVHKQRAVLSISEGLTYEQLIREELNEKQLSKFSQHLHTLGLNESDYLLMPAHPWQWQNKLAMAFAAEIAQRQIVFLGTSEDFYLAQQSIRTFFNISAPHKRYVKTALSVLNMGFMRGLSPYYMLATPAINDWVYKLVEGDTYLQSKGFSILREVAAIGYNNPYYEAAVKENNAFKKMLAALWRECPSTRLRDGEKLMTMTALAHLDNNGRALLAELIKASNISTDHWIANYLEAYFAPLLHCFYRHDLIYMPHGENLIMVLKDHQVVRVLMKDIAEEVGILNPEVELPEIMQRVSTHLPNDMKTLCIFIDIFDGYLRHLAAILQDQCNYTAAQFWHAVARCTHNYQAEHPELAPKFARYDLFADEFKHSCLNRLQMANNSHMLNLEDPASGLQMVGYLKNPLARWRDASHICELA